MEVPLTLIDPELELVARETVPDAGSVFKAEPLLKMRGARAPELTVLPMMSRSPGVEATSELEALMVVLLMEMAAARCPGGSQNPS